jgi:hypothetical protein
MLNAVLIAIAGMQFASATLAYSAHGLAGQDDGAENMYLTCADWLDAASALIGLVATVVLLAISIYEITKTCIEEHGDEDGDFKRPPQGMWYRGFVNAARTMGSLVVKPQLTRAGRVRKSVDRKRLTTDARVVENRDDDDDDDDDE